MSTAVWPAGLRTDEAELLQDGELGFIEASDASFRILPCPWSSLMGVLTGPYLTRNGALDAVRRHLGQQEDSSTVNS